MAHTGDMDTHRPAASGAQDNDLRLPSPAARPTPAPPVVVDTQVPAGERIERVVDVKTVQPEAPAVRTVVTETAPRTAAQPRSRRLAWWVGGGTLTAGAIAALVREALRRRAEQRVALERREAVESLAGPALAAAGTVVSAALAARAARRRRQEDDAALDAVVPVPVLLGDPLDEDAEPLDLSLLEDEDIEEMDFPDEGPVETAPLPLEAVVLVETLLDPALAEGRDLPGAAALRDQLPFVRTVAEALPDVDGEDPVPDWMPLVVEAEDEVELAVPHDFTWPVRGRFVSDDGQTFELTLLVIDGELGSLVVSPVEDPEQEEWDEIPAPGAWPGVHELTFHVDGERRV